MLAFTTPISQRRGSLSSSSFIHGVQVSSSLATSSPEIAESSPSAAQARRRGQYKSRVSSSSSKRTREPDSSPIRPRHVSATIGRRKDVGMDASQTHTQLLRERFEARCIERAKMARAEKVRGGKSWADEQSSDGFDIDMDAEDEDQVWEELADDEFYSRIMLAQARKRQYAFRVSYEREVGSSFDPSFHDVDEYEEQPPESRQEQEIPPDLEDDINEYIYDTEIAETVRELESLDNLSEIFNLSDDEDDLVQNGGGGEEDTAMDMS